jgi:hypothetical protein
MQPLVKRTQDERANCHLDNGHAIYSRGNSKGLHEIKIPLDSGSGNQFNIRYAVLICQRALESDRSVTKRKGDLSVADRDDVLSWSWAVWW